MTDPGAESGPEPVGHWFEPVADHLGEAYLRYSFTKGTVDEVDAILALTGLEPGSSVLDVGCGPGRHALELARRGYRVHGVDISATFVDLARRAAADEGLDHATFSVADARSLTRSLALDADLGPDPHPSFDVALSLCQGAFGLTAGPGADETLPPRFELDEPVLGGMAAAVRPGGAVVVSAFSAYFQLRYQEDHDRFDADLGVNEEPTSVRSADGESRDVRLWTTCYTPRELRLLARAAGLVPDAVHSVSPGRYRIQPPTIDTHEFLLVAHRPASAGGIAETGRYA